MAESRVAMCIPTYGRSKVVEEMLCRCARYYIELGLDIYIYDSSEDDDTREVVEKYADKLRNIYYVKMPSDMHANMKVFKIFQQYNMKRRYDFIWLCGDAWQFSKRLIESVVSQLDTQYDMIEVNVAAVETVGTRVYTDYNEYLKDCAWHLSLFGAVILNVQTMLENVDWEYFEKKYNDNILIYYSHVGFYFERLAEKKEFKALHIRFNPGWGRTSRFRKQAAWYRNTFFVVCNGWISTIEALPDCYTTKEQTILSLGVNSQFKDETRFLELRAHKVYDWKSYKSYNAQLCRMCRVPRFKLALIACMPSGLALRKIKNGMCKYKHSIKSFQDFCRCHSRLVIYGAGSIAYKYADYFEKNNISYEYFCVTEAGENISELLQHKVYAYDTVKPQLKDMGIVIAIGKAYALEIVDRLHADGCGENIFYNEEFTEAVKERFLISDI